MKEYYKKYLIGDVASMFNISTGSVRHYEKIGLINSLKENNNNYRQYNIHLIEQLSNIIMLRSLELSLDEIQHIQTTYYNDIDQVINILQNHIDINLEKIIYLKRLSKKTKQYKIELEKIKTYKNNIVVKKSPKLLFSSLNNILDIEELARNYCKLMSGYMQLPKYSFIVNKEKLIDYKVDLDSYSQFGVCVEYNKALSNDGITLPSKTCAYSIFIGSGVQNVGKKYKEMMNWIYENNYYPSDNAIELCDFRLGNNYIYEIYIPIKTKERIHP